MILARPVRGFVQYVLATVFKVDIYSQNDDYALRSKGIGATNYINSTGNFDRARGRSKSSDRRI